MSYCPFKEEVRKQKTYIQILDEDNPRQIGHLDYDAANPSPRESGIRGTILLAVLCVLLLVGAVFGRNMVSSDPGTLAPIFQH